MMGCLDGSGDGRRGRRLGAIGAVLIVWVAGGVCAAQTATTTASGPVAQDLAPYIPADVLMAYWGRSSPEIRAGDSTVIRLLKWVELARGLNLIPKDYRAISDIAGSLPVVGRYDHLVMLMDVSGKPVGPEGYRLAHMEVGVVVATDGRHDEIVERIRLLLSSYTDKQFGKIEIIDRKGERSYRLTDSRLPVWATWEWGSLGRCYVIGLGEGAFQRVVDVYTDAAKNITSDPWFVESRRRCQGEGAMIEWLVNYKRIKQQLEPVVKGRPERVLEALGAAKLQRGLCTFRLDDRYLICNIMHEMEEGNVFVPLSDPHRMPAEKLRAVPAEASCAVIQIGLADWLTRLCNAYLASQSDREQEQWRKWFADFERRRGVDSRTQLLDRLGNHLIVHTWPVHPLKLPLTLTFLLEIDDPVPVRDFIDALMGEWQDWLRHPTTTTASSRSAATQRTRGQFRWIVGREPDGMWYLQAGIVRPAIAVSDRYVVVSWSPEAVRENLRVLSRMEQRATSVPTSSPR